MMVDFSVRQSTLDDVSGMMVVQEAAYPATFQEPEDMFADIVGNALDTCFVVEKERELIAYLLAHPSEEGRDDYQGGFHYVAKTDVMFLHDLCVTPQIQSKGVGKALFAHFERHTKCAGFSKIIGIAVGEAVPYWQKLGFNMVRSYPYNGMPGQYMEKDL